MGHMVDRKHRDLSDGTVNPEDNDIKVLADTFEAFQNGTLKRKRILCYSNN